MMRFTLTRIHVIIISLVFLVASIGMLFREVNSGSRISWGSKTNAAIEVTLPSEVGINIPFEITVLVDTKKQPVNAIGLYFRFDPTLLQITDLDTRSSFCQYYPEKKFDNNLGTISLACGSPHPGFSGETTVMVLTAIAKAPGVTALRMTPESQVLVSDGKGTNILDDFPQSTVSILNSF